MAKIEEVTALLINEIETFQESVLELKKESNKIQQHKPKIDTTILNLAFSELSKNLSNQQEEQKSHFLTLQNKLNKTVIIPNWMTILFSLFFIIFILSFSINFYQYKKNMMVEKAAYEKGVNTMKDKLQLYFSKNPKTFKHYQNWEKKQ